MYTALSHVTMMNKWWRILCLCLEDKWQEGHWSPVRLWIRCLFHVKLSTGELEYCMQTYHPGLESERGSFRIKKPDLFSLDTNETVATQAFPIKISSYETVFMGKTCDANMYWWTLMLHSLHHYGYWLKDVFVPNEISRSLNEFIPLQCSMLIYQWMIFYGYVRS